jgi:hypothetical protein
MAVTKAAVVFKAVKAKLMLADAAYPSIADVIYTLEIMNFVYPSMTAEAGTTTTKIVLTNHGLSIGDMIVNTTLRSSGVERGSRVIDDYLFDANTLTFDMAIAGQAAGNTIQRHRYEDKTGLLQPGTFALSRKGLGQSTLSFSIITDANYMLVHGQYVRVKATVGAVTTLVFSGRVSSVEDELLGASQTVIRQAVNCQGLMSVANSRSVGLNEAEGSSYGGIAQSMYSEYLYQEGVGLGNVEVGKLLKDDWTADVISVKEVLDECAAKSGFVWYVDDAGLLVFQEPSALVPYGSVPILGSAFSRHKNLKFSVDATDFYNKIFICGGDDEANNPIILAYEDTTAAFNQQTVVGGTGVAGLIQRDSALVDAEYRTVETGSTSTLIKLTAHEQQVGDVVWNFTKDEKRQVLTVPDENQFTCEAFSAVATPFSVAAGTGTNSTTVKITGHSLTARDTMIYNVTRDAYRWVVATPDANTITVAAVPSQAPGDTIEYSGDIFALFDQANAALRDLRTKQGVDPTVMTFDTPVAMEPMTKIKVVLPALGRVDKFFLIEDVDIRDIGQGLSNCWYSIRATARNPDEMYAHRKVNYTDYWKERL